MIFWSAVQFWNAFFSIAVTVEGIEMDVTLVTFWNADDPIVLTPSGKVMLSTAEQ